jgi:hypothetical protein
VARHERVIVGLEAHVQRLEQHPPIDRTHLTATTTAG